MMTRHIPAMPTATDATRPERAGFSLRALARLIDLALVMLVVMTFAPTLPIWGQNLVSVMIGRELPIIEKFVPSSADLVFLFLMFFLAGVSYHTLGSWLHGATMGKLALGLMVRAENGRSPGFGASFIRSLAVLIDGFLFGLVANFAITRSPDRQRFGDRWAHTIVVKRRDWRLTALVRFVAAFVLGLATAVIAAAVISAIQVWYDYAAVGLYG